VEEGDKKILSAYCAKSPILGPKMMKLNSKTRKRLTKFMIEKRFQSLDSFTGILRKNVSRK
jgi:hypothetical protein